MDTPICEHTFGNLVDSNAFSTWSTTGACFAFRSTTGQDKKDRQQQICPRVSAASCTVSTFEGKDCSAPMSEMACACRLCGFAPIFASEVEVSTEGLFFAETPREESDSTVNETMDTMWLALGCMAVVALILVCCRQFKHTIFPKGNHSAQGTARGSPYPKTGATVSTMARV
mmetsp:Transcript_17141/g.37785  ORF Transcript_17141/g.37785 Transcript_17141/m.37785 type:complete len:172 (-) Transcript_17141:166-681(-)